MNYHYVEETTTSKTVPWTDKLGQYHVDVDIYVDSESLSIVDPDPVLIADHIGRNGKPLRDHIPEVPVKKKMGRPPRLAPSSGPQVPAVKAEEYDLPVADIIEKRMAHLVDALIGIINSGDGHAKKDAIIKLIEMRQGKPGTRKPESDESEPDLKDYPEEFDVTEDIL